MDCRPLELMVAVSVMCARLAHIRFGCAAARSSPLDAGNAAADATSSCVIFRLPPTGVSVAVTDLLSHLLRRLA